MPFLYASAPWIALIAYLAIRVRPPRPLAAAGAVTSDVPVVSVVVPARNEERSLRDCVESICASDYPAFEVIVVDDRSDDGTAEVARNIAPNRARRVFVVEGAKLPDGWFGKPWACAQGAQEAQGDLLLFTDADTVHGPSLMGMAVAGLEEDHADALTVMGRQLMETLWERLVQPQVMLAMFLRFSNMRRPCEPRRWRGAIANGQYILFRRPVYEELGGHTAVKNDVTEDQRLAQLLCRSGKKLTVREGSTVFATRMYRSLGELIEGWSKNLATGARHSVPPWSRTPVMWLSLISGGILWIVPPVLAVLGAGGIAPAGWGVWAAWVTGASAVFWAAAKWWIGAPPWYGLLYPLGAVVAGYIFVRSWARGSRIEWKGREYGT